MGDIEIKNAEKGDIENIQIIERDYYGGYFLPRKVLSNWIKKVAAIF